MTRILAIITCLTFPCAAAADSVPDEVIDHLEAAEKAERTDDFSGCVDNLRRAQELYPTATGQLGLARCYTRWPDHCADADGALQAFNDLCASCADRPGADALRAELERSCSASVTVHSDPPGSRVTVDGAGHGVTPTTLRLPKGHHVIEVAHGDVVQSRELDIRSWAEHPVDVSFVEIARPASVQSPVAESPSPWLRPALGVGAAGVAVGAVAGVLWLVDYGEAEDARRGGKDNGEILDSMHAEAWANTIAWSVGAAALGIGTYLYFADESVAPDGTAIGISSDGVWLVGRF